MCSRGKSADTLLLLEVVICVVHSGEHDTKRCAAPAQSRLCEWDVSADFRRRHCVEQEAVILPDEQREQQYEAVHVGAR